MVVPTVFIGMTLPAASKIATRELGSLGRTVGGAFALNTAGTLIGAALAGVILLPYLGIKGTLFVGAGINIFLGLVILAIQVFRLSSVGCVSRVNLNQVSKPICPWVSASTRPVPTPGPPE